MLSLKQKKGSAIMWVCLLLLAYIQPDTMAAEVLPPDAGQTLQNLKAAPKLPEPSQGVTIESPKAPGSESGGVQVVIQTISLKGNTVFSQDVLLQVLDAAPGQSLDLAGMKALADKLTEYYHQHGYPFARAFIPAQTMESGVLAIEVIEGQYGKITVDGQGRRAKSAEKFLSKLKPGEVIEGKELERLALILDDQPGYRFVPVVSPGKNYGEGDLTVLMEKERTVTGSFLVDNFGNRYTGRIRNQLNLNINSPFMLGDQLSINAIYTEGNMWYGSGGYSLPIGHSGLRGNAGYAHTYYELGKEFSAIDATGTAKIIYSGLSYPIIRSQKGNLLASVNYFHKWLTDKQGIIDSVDRKSSDSVRVALNFDLRDNVLGGGITYGYLSWTEGFLDLDENLRRFDRSTAKTDGMFGKLNVDITRLQRIPKVPDFTLSLRASGQVATNNLDSSEDFGLGGGYGVRAYPTGEAFGDSGLFMQSELRYTKFKLATPYLFFDQGYSRFTLNPWNYTRMNNRHIGGMGFGLRMTYKGINADVLTAWRNFGGDPTSDSRDSMPMFWFGLGCQI